VINPQLADTLPNGFCITRMSFGQTANAGIDPRHRLPVFKRHPPTIEACALNYFKHKL
jgi:hypothetical protein